MLSRWGRWLLLPVVAAFVLILGSLMSLQFWPLEGCVTRVNCERITPGMSRTEVYDLLGGPGWRPDCGVGIPPGEDPEFWHGLGYSIRVDFDSRERVIRTKHESRRPRW
jgi:hypothetical protein